MAAIWVETTETIVTISSVTTTESSIRDGVTITVSKVDSTTSTKVSISRRPASDRFNQVESTRTPNSEPVASSSELEFNIPSSSDETIPEINLSSAAEPSLPENSTEDLIIDSSTISLEPKEEIIDSPNAPVEVIPSKASSSTPIVFAWEKTEPLIRLMTVKQVAIISKADPSSRTILSTASVFATYPVEVLIEGQIGGIEYDLLGLIIDGPILPPVKVKDSFAKTIPIRMNGFYLRFNSTYSGEIKGRPEMDEIQSKQDQVIFPLTLAAGEAFRKLSTEFRDGLETIVSLARYFLGRTPLLERAFIGSVFLTAQRSDGKKPSRFDLYLQRLRKFTGLTEKQLDGFRIPTQPGSEAGICYIAITGSAMAYVGRGKHLDAYADSDIDVLLTLNRAVNKHQQYTILSQTIPKILIQIGFQPDGLISDRKGNFSFQIPNGRKMDFYVASRKSVWTHHVAPARMLYSNGKFLAAPSAVEAYRTGKITDIKYVLSSTQTRASILKKYAKRGWDVSSFLDPSIE